MSRYARVEIHPFSSFEVGVAALRQAAHDVGLAEAVEAIHPAKLFFLAHPELREADVEKLSQTLLTDPVVERVEWSWSENNPTSSTSNIIEVEYHPGVTDRVAYEVRQAALRLGLPPLKVATGYQYHIQGKLSQQELHLLARQVLCNEVVQH